VDKVLDTVLNNLLVTNNIDIDPSPHCRVLLTDNLELFTIGHTIVLSRGLIDVLPDEATLAVLLAQELAASMVPKANIDRYAFGDALQVPTTRALKQFSFRESAEDQSASRQAALEILSKSPYRDKLGNSQLFLAQLQEESKPLRSLISPNLGNRVYLSPKAMSARTNLDSRKLDQIAALPIGARVKLDPWTDHVEMLKARSVPLESEREKMPFEITPFAPYLTRYGVGQSQPSGQSKGTDAGPEAASSLR
jgi:hypothetical protein